MKKAIIITCVAVFGLIILIESHILEALLSLLLAGAIPGTPFTIPSGVMLVILVSIAWVVLFRVLATTEPVEPPKKPRSLKSHTGTKKRIPKRRYKQA